MLKEPPLMSAMSRFGAGGTLLALGVVSTFDEGQKLIRATMPTTLKITAAPIPRTSGLRRSSPMPPETFVSASSNAGMIGVAGFATAGLLGLSLIHISE